MQPLESLRESTVDGVVEVLLILLTVMQFPEKQFRTLLTNGEPNEFGNKQSKRQMVSSPLLQCESTHVE